MNKKEWISSIPITMIGAIIMCAVVWLSYFFPNATLGGGIGHSDFWGNYPSSVYVVHGTSHPPSASELMFSLVCGSALLSVMFCAWRGFDRAGKIGLVATWFGIFAIMADVLVFGA